jgi:FKBP-type peptidyl-prolyl cis-trans isomerase
VVVVLVALAFGLACSKAAPRKTSLATDAERFSYALGLDIGANLKNIETEVDLPTLIQGMQDTLGGQASLMTQEAAGEVRQQFATKFREAQAAKAREAGERNRAEGAAFLEQNKTKEGVITTASGLQYMIMTEGTGPKPAAANQVKVHYRGTLIDGTEFDSSYSRGEPVVFGVGGVIPGWVEALQLMPVGSKYKLFIPPQLAYGERGAGAQIGPNSVLIFEVELLGIEN